MTFVESTTKVVKLGNSSSIPSVIIKDTITVEDIVFLHARTAAVRKKSNIAFSTTSQNIRQQITRVPHGR